MKILSISIFFAFLFSGVIAQDKFIAGYYLTNTADTVQGYIQYKSKYDDEFKFRPNLKASSQTITIDQVKSFKFSSGTTYARVENFSTAKGPTKPIFARQIVQGEVDLVYYEGTMYIGSEKRGRFALAKKRSSNTGDGLKNQQNNIGAFNILFQDCAKVKEQAQKTPIVEEKLTELLRSYHECLGIEYKEFKTEKMRRKFDVGFFAGQSFSKLSFGKPETFSETNYLYNSSFKTSSSPTFGIQALVGGKSPSSIISFQSGIAYTKADYKATWSYTKADFGGYDISQTSTTHVEYNLLSVSAGVRLTGRSNTLNPYVGFGFASHQFLSLKEGVHQVTTINSSVEEQELKIGMAKSALAVWGCAGLKKRIAGKKALFVEGSYESSNVSINDPMSAKVSVMSLKLGFMF